MDVLTNPSITHPTAVRSRARLAAVALVAVSVVAACSSTAIKDRAGGPTTTAGGTTTAAPAAAVPADIVATAVTGVVFTELAGLVVDAGLVDTLRSAGPFTVFAPIDAAFEKLPASTLSAVQADPKLLAKVLTYHVVAGKLSTSDLKAGKLMTVAGVELTVTKKDGQTLIDGHPIAVANVEATNGIIQVMGDVLVPG